MNHNNLKNQIREQIPKNSKWAETDKLKWNLLERENMFLICKIRL